MVLRAAFNLAFLIVQVWYQGTLKGKMSEWFRAVVISLLMGMSLYRAVVRPLFVTADLIMRGDNTRLIDRGKGNTEITKVLDAFKTSQVKNGFNEAEAKRAANHNLRIKIALDNVSANVVVLDDNLKIIYLNKSAEKMFRVAEADIRK